ncbi:MAG: hypothetical protein R3F61_35755 [Myxococcota bacterium]
MSGRKVDTGRKLGMEPSVEERRRRIVELLALGAVRAARARSGLDPLPGPDEGTDEEPTFDSRPG